MGFFIDKFVFICHIFIVNDLKDYIILILKIRSGDRR